jgi:hypothetical protein
MPRRTDGPHPPLHFFVILERARTVGLSDHECAERWASFLERHDLDPVEDTPTERVAFFPREIDA